MPDLDASAIKSFKVLAGFAVDGGGDGFRSTDGDLGLCGFSVLEGISGTGLGIACQNYRHSQSIVVDMNLTRSIYHNRLY